MTAQFNPDVRDLYEQIIKRNVVSRDNQDYFPERYGGSRVRDIALSGNDGHFPTSQQVMDSTMGGFYGRASHPIVVGSGRRCGGVGILKERVRPVVNEIDMDYMPVSASHGSGRAPRLTNAIKQRILDMHPELQQHHMQGGKINWGKIWKDIKSTASFVSKAAPIAASLAPEEYRDSINKAGTVSTAISGMGRSGGSMAQMAIIDLSRKIAKKRGGNKTTQFFKDFGTGFKMGLKGVTKVAAPALGIASVFQPELAPLAAATGIASKALGNGRKQLPRSGKKRNTARGDIVSAIMRQRGVSLGEASRIVKEEGLY